MTPCCTDILKEVPCPQPGEGPIWFSCAYGGNYAPPFGGGGCHAGVGHVVLTANDGTVLYDGNPTGGSSKKIYIQFNAAKLHSLGGSMEVTYKPGDANWGHHACNWATWNWGYNGSDTIAGTAYLDNTGGVNDRGTIGPRADYNPASDNGGARLNTFTIPPGSASPLPVVTSTSSQRTVCYEVIPSCGPCANQQPTGIWTPAASSQCGTFTQFDYGTDPLCPPFSRVVTGPPCFSVYKVGGLGSNPGYGSTCIGCGPVFVGNITAATGAGSTVTVECGPVNKLNSVEAVGVNPSGVVVCYKNVRSTEWAGTGRSITVSYDDCINQVFSAATSEWCGYNYPFPAV
jgi:hypothetical protein